ncbi:8372_t:CDS:10 [Diversispora eburnea]|uniref:8372_t:CDS:1 n=1 Tax=Diversispora eburnea TaxID=1213867 RepID=A0A9N9CXA7_9GLOM|nr:8372_t:CDS:10 [Diversispora eburnea]
MSKKYFERPCSEWNILGFLNKCEENQFNDFEVNISYYLLCLEAISKEEGSRSKKAQVLLDRYRKASTGFFGGWKMGGKGFPEDPKPDYKIARNWEAERVKKQVHLHNPTFVDQGIGTISGGTSGTINGFIVESSKRETPCNDNESYVHYESSDLDNGKNHGEINNDIDNIANEEIYLLSQETPQNVTEDVYKIIEKIKSINYRLFDYKIINLSERNITNPVNKLSSSEKHILKDTWNSLEPSDRSKTIRFEKWKKIINPLVQKYQPHLESKSVFDVISLSDTIEVVLEKPYTGKFIHKEHYDLIWVQDIYKRFLFLFDAPTNLLSDPDQCKNRNETRQYKQRVSIGCSQDGIYSINVNAVVLEVGFLEVVGSALYTDIKKLNGDTEKVLKCMQISIHYQRQHYLSRGATEQQVSLVESYGIVVYHRTFTIYVMHRTNEGLYVVDTLTEFSIPNTKDQLYILKEVIENVYFFKSRVMDYYLTVQKIVPYTKIHVGINESPVEASPSKASMLLKTSD